MVQTLGAPQTLGERNHKKSQKMEKTLGLLVFNVISKKQQNKHE